MKVPRGSSSKNKERPGEAKVDEAMFKYPVVESWEFALIFFFMVGGFGHVIGGVEIPNHQPGVRHKDHVMVEFFLEELSQRRCRTSTPP